MYTLAVTITNNHTCYHCYGLLYVTVLMSCMLSDSQTTSNRFGNKINLPKTVRATPILVLETPSKRLVATQWYDP